MLASSFWSFSSAYIILDSLSSETWKSACTRFFTIIFSMLFFILSEVSGYANFVIFISSKVAIRVSLSVLTFASIHIAQYSGFDSPFFNTETAALTFILLPLKESNCGWYIVITALETTISRGQLLSGLSSSACTFIVPNMNKKTITHNNCNFCFIISAPFYVFVVYSSNYIIP